MVSFAILIKGVHKERTKSSEMEALETEQECSNFFAIDFFLFLWMNYTTIINVAI